MFMGTRFADMADPLIELTKKNVPFVWEERHTQAIRMLKNRLVNYTLLQLPDPKKPYVLWTDASAHSLGAALLQDGKPLGFISKKMSEQQQRYSTYQQELLALLTALKKWQHLLRPRQVTAYTDHRTLQHILNAKSSALPSGMLVRWLSLLAEFPCLTITYKPRKDNVVADALSRNPLHQDSTTRHGTTYIPAIAAPAILATVQARATRSGRQRAALGPSLVPGTAKWGEALRTCPAYSDIFKAAEQQSSNRVYMAATSPSSDLTYPSRIYKLHSEALQMSKAVTQKPAGLLHSLAIPAKRWDSISMDFVTGLPVSDKGNDAIMVVVDRLSKMAHFIPIPVSSTAADIAAIFIREVVRLHGVPSSFVTD
ncbi:hypothetical protein Emag_006866 [Eimeria magna]